MLDILFISDRAKLSEYAGERVAIQYPSTIRISWAHGDPLDFSLDDWQGDYILSFKSDLVLSARVLSKARIGALNFHPAPPKYRGIGGEYYAVWNNDETFGATCHLMDDKIDHGPILKVMNFPILSGETAKSVKTHADISCLALLEFFLFSLKHDIMLHPTQQAWGPVLYNRKMLTEAIARQSRVPPDGETSSHPVSASLARLTGSTVYN